jgi:hypothetical protein
MAINVSFNGATIFKPGAYSKTTIDLGGGFPLSPTGLVAIFGESDKGAPGSEEIDISNNVFSPEQIADVREKYGSGPLVDAVSFLFSPAADGAIPSGAQAVYIYKTNASTKSQLVLANSYGTLKSLQYGIDQNQITYRNTLISETAASVTASAAPTSLTISVGVNDEIKYRINGGTESTATIPAATYGSAALLAAAIDGVLTGLSCDVNVAALRITQDAGSNLHQNGWGRSFELSGGNALTNLNFTAGAQALPTVEPGAIIRIKDNKNLIEEEDTVGGNVVMSIGFDSTSNDATSATVQVTSTNVVLTVVGGAQAGTNTLTKSAYSSLSQLSAAINLIPGWSSALTSTLYGQLPLSVLDEVSAIGAHSETGKKPARIKKDAQEVADMLALSSLVSIESQAQKGLPNTATEVALTGGAKGATLTSDVTDALAEFEKIRVNSVVPLFSRDASADISDALTDAGSTYTILGIHQAVKTHLSLMSTTKNKSERQGYLSYKASYVDSKQRAQDLADARIQLLIQDVRQIDAFGNIKWFQPWALACILSGARGGSPVGTPMTFKFMNVSGIRHTAQAMSTPEQNIVIDFDPDSQYDDAIQNGLTFLEAPQTGGFRVVVDNTTYGRDGNWVYNRGNVLYAADVLAFDFRNQLEAIYVGVKNTVQAAEVKSTCESILATYLAQGITVSTTDAPNGFKNLVVRIEGNTIYVNVIVKLVEGIDFILADITLQRASSQA